MVGTRIFDSQTIEVRQVVVKHLGGHITAVHSADGEQRRVIHRLVPTKVIVSRAIVIRMVDDGVVSADGLVMGTYIHGIFENDGYRRALLDALRSRKGLPAIAGETVSYMERKEAAYDRLAELVRANLDMAHVRRVMGLES